MKLGLKSEKEVTDEVVQEAFEDWVENFRMKSMKPKFAENTALHHTNEEFLGKE